MSFSREEKVYLLQKIREDYLKRAEDTIDGLLEDIYEHLTPGLAIGWKIDYVLPPETLENWLKEYHKQKGGVENA
ncbi:MAG: hypothetical protein DRO18_04810 [Thermoprotei archaeon]|nr:MAG: hypothetical protein DRO18_04810 [Thermoprotei archaeon]